MSGHHNPATRPAGLVARASARLRAGPSGVHAEALYHTTVTGTATSSAPGRYQQRFRQPFPATVDTKGEPLAPQRTQSTNQPLPLPHGKERHDPRRPPDTTPPHPATHTAYAASGPHPAQTGGQPEAGTTATASATATGKPPGTDAARTGREAHDGVAVGAVAVRVFRAARRRRLAMPADQRPRLTPGLIAELEARGWTIPDELRPQPDPGTAPSHGRAHRPRQRRRNNPGTSAR